MSETKHTPGPWVAEPVMQDLSLDICLDYQIPGAGNPVTIGFAHGQDDDSGPDRYTGPGSISSSQAEANARLMAAAPDLLRELIRVHDEYSWCTPHVCDATCLAKIAINKATGQK